MTIKDVLSYKLKIFHILELYKTGQYLILSGNFIGIFIRFLHIY